MVGWKWNDSHSFTSKVWRKEIPRVSESKSRLSKVKIEGVPKHCNENFKRKRFANDLNDPTEYFNRMATISFCLVAIFGFTGFASIWFNSLIIHWVMIFLSNFSFSILAVYGLYITNQNVWGQNRLKIIFQGDVYERCSIYQCMFLFNSVQDRRRTKSKSTCLNYSTSTFCYFEYLCPYQCLQFKSFEIKIFQNFQNFSHQIFVRIENFATVQDGRLYWTERSDRPWF